MFVDRLGAQREWATNWLAFSHGRAAFAWIVQRRQPKSALVCAYTCPSVLSFLRHVRIEPSLFDVGAPLDTFIALAKRLPSPQLVIFPSLFGSPPWHDIELLAEALGRSAVVLIDAAQTAFGHRDFVPPTRGATLACPRKTTGLADGAVLALGRGLAAEHRVEVLPVASEAAAWKYAARALWATRKPEYEMQALAFNSISEQLWPDEPHRMTEASRILFERIDMGWHRRARRRNRQILAAALADKVMTWAPDRGTPFSLPIFVHRPASLIAELKRQRIFATTLWPDAEHDPDRHPAAAYMARHLVSLPVDQRHNETDMTRIAEAVLQAAPSSPSPPPTMLQTLIG